MKIITGTGIAGLFFSKEFIKQLLERNSKYVESQLAADYWLIDLPIDEYHECSHDYYDGEYFHFILQENDLKFRTDTDVISLIEEMGEAAGEVKVIEIPDDIEFEIKSCDGPEWIAEKHRTWT